LGDLIPQSLGDDNHKKNPEKWRAAVTNRIEMWLAAADRRCRRPLRGDGRTDHERLALKQNRFFKQPSIVTLFRAADWDLSKIPKKDLWATCHTFLAPLQQVQAGTETDAACIKAMEASGSPNVDIQSEVLGMLRIRRLVHDVNKEQRRKVVEVQQRKHEEQVNRPRGERAPIDTSGDESEWSYSCETGLREHINEFKYQIDLRQPWLCVNYARITRLCFKMFDLIEEGLEQSGNQTYKDVYLNSKEENLSRQCKRLRLTSKAFNGRDPGVLEVVGRVFEENRATFEDNRYWEYKFRSDGNGPE